MKTVVRTKIYEIRESARGYSQAIYFFFNEQTAKNVLEELQKQFKGTRWNYKLVSHTCQDSLIWVED